MSDKCIVSIIMAVYNSEDYVADVVASILRERTLDMEVILVDDGSTDGSGIVCNQLAAEDSRVRVVHEENAGMCHARNVGIRVAHGDWVTFVDNDDEVLPGFVDDNLALARKYDADVVRFGRRLLRISENGAIERSTDAVPPEERFLTAEELRSQLWLADYGTNGPWSGFYRRMMLLDNNISFPESFRSGWEDVWFNDQVIRVASSYAFNPKCLYEWRRRASHSTSMKMPPQNLIDSVAAVLSLEWSMMSDYCSITQRPEWCSERLFMQVRGLVTLPAFQRVDAESERVVFVQVRKLLEPYLAFMSTHCPDGVDGFMLRLIIRQWYGLLRAVVHGGVAVKRNM